MTFNNLKIAINDQQPLDEVVEELERLGYKWVRRTKSQFIGGLYIYDDGVFEEYPCFSNDCSEFLTTTLAELKEM